MWSPVEPGALDSGSVKGESTRRQRTRGEIEELPSGSLRVRVFAGRDPESGKRCFLTETVPRGPGARAVAEQTRDRLLRQVDDQRSVRTEAMQGERRDSTGWPAASTEPFKGMSPRALDIYLQLLAGRRPEIPDDVRTALVCAHLLVGGMDSAVRPTDALNDLFARRLPAALHDLGKLVELADTLQGVTRALTGQHGDDGALESSPAIELLMETRQRGDAHRAAISGAQHELMIVEGAMPTPRPTQITPASVTRQPGARWREIHSLSSMRDPELARRALEHIPTFGVEVRLIPTPPVWLTVADDEVALISTGPTPRSGVLLVRVPEMVQMMRQWFDVLWVTATPVSPEVGEATPEHAEASTQRLLRLLATGLTDDAIGRLLGVSPRTIRRRVAELEAVAGATNRLQLALRAAELGWVPRPPGD